LDTSERRSLQGALKGYPFNRGDIRVAKRLKTNTSKSPVFDAEDERIWEAMDYEAYNERSIYNQPGFKSVHKQISHGNVELISGAIPSDLEGVYIRNGTNPQFEPASARYHMFDGAGMLHQIQIKGGVATYSNTYIRTPRFNIERDVGREVYLSFSDFATLGTLVGDKAANLECKMADGRLPRLSSYEQVQNSTAIQWHHGRLYTLSEAGYPFKLSTHFRPDGRLVLDGSGTFETWDGRLLGAFSAHPRIDPDTGDFYSVTTAPGNKLTITHLQKGKLRECIQIDQECPDGKAMAHCHDYFLTENFIVFPDMSFRMSEEFLATDAQSMWKFDPGYMLRWGVLRRDFQPGDKPRWFTTGHAAALWHMVNGWEEKRPGGETDIVLFAPMFDTYPSDMPIHTPEEPHAKLHKWVLNLDSGKVTIDRRLLEGGWERPSSNLAYIGKPSQWGYLIDEAGDGYMGKGVLKYDLINEKEVKFFSYGEYYGGEALFVPRRDSQAEDDGYLLELLIANSLTEPARLLILDAKTMDEVARLEMPQRVTFGVHACWLDERKLAAFDG
jgi:carotenoid cleavage dioxygenase